MNVCEPIREEVLREDNGVESFRISRAVLRIKEIFVSKALESYVELGEYLLSEFYDNDMSVFESRNAKKNSLRRLSEREELGLSYSTLSNAVRVAPQYRKLVSVTTNARLLTFSHHVEMLPLHDDDLKLELVGRSVSSGLKVRELRELVKKNRPRNKRGAGRPPLPKGEKVMTRLQRQKSDDDDLDELKRILDVFPAEKTAKLKAFTLNVSRQIKDLTTVQEAALRRLQALTRRLS